LARKTTLANEATRQLLIGRKIALEAYRHPLSRK
jgi:hypothetical protein